MILGTVLCVTLTELHICVQDRKKYEKFFSECGVYFREGLITAEDDYQKACHHLVKMNIWCITVLCNCDQEEVAKLFRFESSFERPGVTTALPDYVSRMKPNQQNIYFLCATRYSIAMLLFLSLIRDFCLMKS